MTDNLSHTQIRAMAKIDGWMNIVSIGSTTPTFRGIPPAHIDLKTITRYDGDFFMIPKYTDLNIAIAVLERLRENKTIDIWVVHTNTRGFIVILIKGNPEGKVNRIAVENPSLPIAIAETLMQITKG